MSDTWEEFERTLVEHEGKAGQLMGEAMAAGIDVDKLASLHERVSRMLDALKGVQTFVESGLAGGVEPKMNGSHTLTGDKWEIIIAWGERREWDQATLDRLVKADTANDPEFIKRKIAVDKRLWDKADDEDKRAYIAALTTKPGTRTITVNRIAS